MYDLSNYNCTDFGIEIANSVGFGLPSTNGDWTLPWSDTVHGSSRNPGDLGEDIRALNHPGEIPSGNINKSKCQ